VVSPPTEEPHKYEVKRTRVRSDFNRTFKKLCQGKNNTLWHFTGQTALKKNGFVLTNICGVQELVR